MPVEYNKQPDKKKAVAAPKAKDKEYIGVADGGEWMHGPDSIDEIISQAWDYNNINASKIDFYEAIRVKVKVTVEITE